jgi:hypothetical protein
MRKHLLAALAGLFGACTAPTHAPAEAARPLTSRAAPEGELRLDARGDDVLVGVLRQAPGVDSEAPDDLQIREVDVKTGASRVRLEHAQTAAYSPAGLLAVEGGRLRLHTEKGVRTLLDHVAPDLALDPTGQWLAVVVRSPAFALDTDVVLMPAIGGTPRVLAAFPGSAEDRPFFTPDARRVAFVSGKSGLASWWKVDLKPGAQPEQVTNVGLQARGGLPESFVPVPVDRASVRFEGASTLVYEAAGKPVRVELGGAR